MVEQNYMGRWGAPMKSTGQRMGHEVKPLMEMVPEGLIWLFADG